MAKINEWLSASKLSGTGNAEITLTASSYEELIERTTSLKIQGISANAILNVRQTALVPSATLDSYKITTYGGGTYTNGITSNVPWTAVVNGDWITIDKTQGESGYTTLSITLDAPTEARNGSIIFNAEGVVLTLQISQIYDLDKSYFWVEFEDVGGTISGLTNDYTEMYHSFDGTTWIETPNTLSMGDNTLVYFINDSKTLGRDTSSQYNFHLALKFDKYAKVGGDLSSLTDMKRTALMGLFYANDYLVDASELILPWDSLSEYCCKGMFYGCTSLTAAPALPATDLADNCYYEMFEGCTSLTTAPTLPAITLVESCYANMFEGCTSLTTAPTLPATTLAKTCYSSMFEGCTSLTTAPELPSTVMKDYCYSSMFKGCTSLEETPILPASLIVNGCYYGMFQDCSNLGYVKMFAKDLTGATIPLKYWLSGTKSEGLYIGATDISSFSVIPDYIPSNWVKIHGFPEDPNIPIDEYFWVEFENVNGVITGLKGVYSDIYYSFDCVNWLPCSDSLEMGNNKKVYLLNKTRRLNTHANVYINIQFTSNAKIGGYLSSLGYAAYQGNFKGLFMNNTYLTDASELILPWAVLVVESYAGMFYGCTSLVTAPELPATTLAWGCYLSMFAGCSSLNYIKMLAPEAHDGWVKSLETWVVGVAPTGTFVKAAENTTIPVDSVNGIPIGWTVVNAEIPEEPTDPDNPYIEELKQQYFWVEFEQPNGVISEFTNDYTEMYHSFDGSTWLTTPKTLSMGDNTLVYFRNDSKKISTSTTQLIIKFNRDAKVGGDLSSITNMTEACCHKLFYNNTYLTDASELKLPWTTLADWCYANMFEGCTSLTTAPELPATTLAYYCYAYMFKNCTSLTTAPALPATTLDEKCYRYMFYGCTSLVNAPELPAITLAKYCYEGMFEGCTSLVNAPALPATTLADYCYCDMFYGCTSLITAPELPATTLTQSCYSQMFRRCTNLTTAPTLKATKLVSRCYDSMFMYCSKLNYIKMLAYDGLENTYGLDDWVDGVPSEGTFVKHPDADLPRGISGIPYNWTVETATE